MNFNNLQEAIAQIVQRGKTGTTECLSSENGEANLDLVEPRTVFWGVGKAHALALVAQESLTAGEILEYAPASFLTEIILETNGLGKQANESLRLMRVELVRNKDPFGIWVLL